MTKHSDRLAAAVKAHAGGDLGSAEGFYRKVLAHDRRSLEALRGLGLLLVQTGQVAEGDKLLSQLAALAPRRADSWFVLGYAKLRLGDLVAAAAIFARAVSIDPGLSEAWNNLGGAIQSLGQGARALQPFRRAAVLSGDPGMLANLAQMLEMMNALDEAGDRASAALSARPDLVQARLVLARIHRRSGRFDPARAAIEDVLRANPGPEWRGSAQLELAQILDRTGDPAGAFAAIVEGKRQMGLTAVAKACDPARYERLLAAIEAAPSPPSGARDSGRVPVFFVGFPRSGTTLTEEILDRHSRLRTSGEQSPLEAVTARLRGAAYGGDADALRALFWSQVAIPDEAILIDKMPFNLVHLQTIAWLFPQAKIIMALRDPRDVVWSCFAQEFALNDAMVHFLTLEGTARLYGRVMNLWRRFESRLPLDYFVYRYEDFVRDPEDHARRLAKFLDVGFESEMLQARQSRFIATPSRDMAAGPITDRAIGRWRRYRAQLAPVLPMLDEFVAAFNYERD